MLCFFVFFLYSFGYMFESSVSSLFIDVLMKIIDESFTVYCLGISILTTSFEIFWLMFTIVNPWREKICGGENCAERMDHCIDVEAISKLIEQLEYQIKKNCCNTWKDFDTKKWYDTNNLCMYVIVICVIM